MGYSAISFGAAMVAAAGKDARFFSVEKSPLFAAVATSLIDLAGLREQVRVLVGTGGEGVERVAVEGLLGSGGAGKKTADMFFFDHHKPSYTADLQRAERLGLIGEGTMLVADNMIMPGNPPYAAWVRASVAEKREKAKEAGGGENTGNPNLVYKSRFVKSYEPGGEDDAIEFTECVCVESGAIYWVERTFMDLCASESE